MAQIVDAAVALFFCYDNFHTLELIEGAPTVLIMSFERNSDRIIQLRRDFKRPLRELLAAF